MNAIGPSARTALPHLSSTPVCAEPARALSLRTVTTISREKLTAGESGQSINARFAFAVLDSLLLTPGLSDAERIQRTLSAIDWWAVNVEPVHDLPAEESRHLDQLNMLPGQTPFC